jgi:DNA (cytosine-5)-methyltransferase 1
VEARIMSRPRLLDLFCCQGGAGHGYRRAGFDVTGVDIAPQPRNPHRFIQADALDYLEQFGDQYHAIHASPPCQAFTKAQRLQANEHPDLIAPVRDLLRELGVPYVIENVEGAPLINPIMLCGTMFGLRLYRHRLFECSFPVTPPLHGQHWLRQVKMGRKAGPQDILQPVGNFTGVDEAREAMGMPWANRDGLREAVPPAYTEFIGGYLMAAATRDVRDVA